MEHEDTVKKELLEILNSNMIYYEVKGNEGQHIRVFEEDRSVYWNIYFPSLKFHKDGQASTQRGVKNFLKNFNLAMVDKNQVAIQIVDHTVISADKISDHQIKIRTKDDFKSLRIVIPFNIDFSITPMDSDNKYNIRQLGDGWEVSMRGSFVVSSSFKLYISDTGSRNWDISKEMQEEGQIDDEVEL